MVNSKELKPQSVLVIEGAVDDKKEANAEKFQKEVFEGPLKGIESRSVPIEIEVKMSVGAPYKKIEGVVDIEKLDETTIEHKPG